jgi:hypothetical protein
MFTGDFGKNALENDFRVAIDIKRFTLSVLIMNKHYLRNAITGLYFDGLSWASLKPVKSFDGVDVAFIRCVWENVVAVPLTPEQEANEEGWSLEWFR